MKTIAYLLFASAALMACEETVQLDPRQTPSKIVIEGLVTNVAGRQYVKVSRTTGFYQPGPTPRVTNADVHVVDDLGNMVMFAHNPNQHPDSSGYYFPSSPFTGQIGRVYTVSVDVNGEIYTASDKMTHTLQIDSLLVQKDLSTSDHDQDLGRIYQVLVYGKEPGDSKDFYLVNVYRNDTIVYNAKRGAFILDDQAVTEEINGVPAPANFRLNDHAMVECLSLSREAYVFYNGMSRLTTGSGGMFDSPPANPVTNLSNGAMGFFQASAVVSSKIVVKEN